jgi:hypothetical protein
MGAQELLYEDRKKSNTIINIIFRLIEATNRRTKDNKHIGGDTVPHVSL